MFFFFFSFFFGSCTKKRSNPTVLALRDRHPPPHHPTHPSSPSPSPSIPSFGSYRGEGRGGGERGGGGERDGGGEGRRFPDRISRFQKFLFLFLILPSFLPSLLVSFLFSFVPIFLIMARFRGDSGRPARQRVLRILREERLERRIASLGTCEEAWSP